MRIIVLGAGAGGGVPQWNCCCSVCRGLWRNGAQAGRRTQSSLAVSPDGKEWLLLNCSPDIREQIGQTESLWPRANRRGSPITDIALTGGEIDHVAGLLSLREGARFFIHATRATHDTLVANPIFGALSPEVVIWRNMELGAYVNTFNGLQIEPFAVPGKLPLYMEGENPETDAVGEATVGLAVTGRDGKYIVYIPGCARIDGDLRERVHGASALFLDGTVFSNDELIHEGVGHKTGRRMGHQPISGEDGSIAALSSVEVDRRIFVHINNTNPILLRESPQRAAVEAAGWEVGWDGMEIEI
jgi:pyrroloquinoline quinone biosynthesis protein B